MSCTTDTGYPLGSSVICEFEFRDPTTNALVDPTNVFAAVKTPNGVTTIYQYSVDAEVEKSAVGEYFVTVNAAAPGTWHYRGYSTGTYKGANEDSFEVNASEFA
jgi:hypothetical protein